MILETFLVQVVSSNCISDRLSYLVGHETILSLPMGSLLLEKYWERVIVVYSQDSQYSICIIRGGIQNKQDYLKNNGT